MSGTRTTVEEGYVDFTGQTSKNITLTKGTFRRGEIQTMVVELPGTYSTGSASPSNNVNDIPVNYYGTVQVSAQFTTDTTIVISTTSPFYGRVHWSISSN